MITLDNIRKIAMELPDVEEGTHFRLPSFKIQGKGFVVVQKDAVIFSVSKAYAETLARDNRTFQIVTRNQDIFVGVRALLDELNPQDLRTVIKAAYKNKK